MGVLEEVMEDYRDLFSAPQVVPDEFGLGFESREVPFDRVAQKEAPFTQ